MRNKTFEILAKWACNGIGISLEFRDDIDTACASPSGKKIMLPTNIKCDNPYAATAVVVHEAGHIKSTDDELCKKVVVSKEDKNIHNVMEDIRIDRASFSLLNNMRDFFHILYESEMPSPEDMQKIDPTRRALMRCICKLEGMSSDIYKQIPKDKNINYNDLEKAIEDGIYGLDSGDATRLRAAIEETKKVLSLEDTEPAEMPAAGDSKNGQGGKGKGQGKGSGNGKGKGDPAGSPGAGWGTEHILQKDRIDESLDIPTHVLREMTRQRFCELLKEKIKKTLPAGNKLNTKKLMSFHTGDVESLFKNEVKRKRYHSKIMFLLDQSGSMDDNLCDRANKWRTMIKVLKPIIELVAALKAGEGIDIDFEVWTFDHQIIEKYTVDNIDMLFKTRPMGGTNIHGAFTSAQEAMLTDTTLNGRKLILLATDGQVHDSEILDVKQEILKFNEDVRCIMVGIGAEQYARGELLKHNIVGEAVAEDVILEAISEML